MDLQSHKQGHSKLLQKFSSAFSNLDGGTLTWQGKVSTHTVTKCNPKNIFSFEHTIPWNIQGKLCHNDTALYDKKPTCMYVTKANRAENLICMSYYRVIILLIAYGTLCSHTAADLCDLFLPRRITVLYHFLRPKIGSLNIWTSEHLLSGTLSVKLLTKRVKRWNWHISNNFLLFKCIRILKDSLNLS